jgi:hypothetical protein
VERRAAFGLTAVFVATRVAYAIAGVRFDTAVPLRKYMHFVDVRLLQDDLWTSVWHLHSQPPLFNLILGAVLHLPGSDAGWFQVLYLAMGATLTLTMFLLMRELGVPVGLAFVSTAVFIVVPVTVLYENFLFYTYPVAVGFVASGLFLVRYLRSRRPLYGVLLFSTLTFLVLTRSTYHLVWLLAVAAGVVVLARPARARALALLLIPVVVAVGWYAKTWVEFGTTSGSSWAGMNLAKVTLQQAPPGEIKDLVRHGDLSRQALILPFTAPEAYGPLPRRTGVAVLDERRKTGGEINYNHQLYVDVSDQYFDDAVSFIRAHPGEYARMAQYSFRFFWLPGDDFVVLEPNRAHLDGLDRILNRFLFLQPSSYFSSELRGYTRPVSAYAPALGQVAWGAVLVYLAAWSMSAAALWALVRRKHIDRARAATIAFLGLTVLYVTVASNAFELGENNRFRFETDAVAWVLFVALLARAIGLIAKAKESRARRTRGL